MNYKITFLYRAKVIYFFVLLSTFFSCKNDSVELRKAMVASNKNIQNLTTVLTHYKNQPEKKDKYEAACFLISNMMYHYSYDFPFMDDYYRILDSLLIPQRRGDKQKRDLFEKIGQVETQLYQENIKIKRDIEHIEADYLIKHIEQAFDTRRYPWCRNLSFEDFFEYVLPYRVSIEPLTTN